MDRTIPIAKSDQIGTVQTAYRAIIALGGWLPWVTLAFLAAGVLVAPRRSVALLAAAVGLGLSMLLLVLGIVIGRGLLLATVPPAVVPGAVTGLLYDTATAAIHDTAVIGVVLAIAVAVVAWFAGPFQAPRRFRGYYTDGVGALRNNAEQHGVTTGRVGEWVYNQRRLLHVIIALAAAAAIILLRPLSVSDIVGTLVLAVLALVVVTLVERPERPEPPARCRPSWNPTLPDHVLTPLRTHPTGFGQRRARPRDPVTWDARRSRRRTVAGVASCPSLLRAGEPGLG